MTPPTKNSIGAKEVAPATENKITNQPAVNGKNTASKGVEKPRGEALTPPITLIAVEPPAARHA